MPISTYVFYYKADSTCEPIGRVKATSLAEARMHIIEFKQLPEDVITELFEIKQVLTYETNI
jgi:hypothetical protein